jgi:anhydro-N-acetylmuramic acid kinase
VYLRDALLHRKGHSYEDLVATVTRAVAQSIVRAFDRFIKPKHEIARIIVSGGGAHNKALLAFIKQGIPDASIRTSEQYGLPSNAREAIAFAILGNETLCGTPANVPSATGARHSAVLGKITPGDGLPQGNSAGTSLPPEASG